ncbi:MAG TPA: HD domain-containing phosphohydrolase [Candidatus Eisenbacteria bacterium]|nr:HD domain-containing phosphohydrolase [Candidatus Eisenbacteria bacterium]
MSSRRRKGPSALELKLQTDLLRARREIDHLRKDGGGEGTEDHPLARRVQELERIKERLSRLYFTQLHENQERAARLQEILQALSEINAERELETLLDRIASTIQDILEFRIVLVRLRDARDERFRAVAFAGLGAVAQSALEREEIELDDVLSWLRPDFKVSHSYFIGHKDPFNRLLPPGYVPDLGSREPWEWHAEDVLLVPLVDGRGEMIGYFSVDDPADRLVPSKETIELLEVFATHAVVAIENARLNRQIALRTRELEAADMRMKEMDELKSRFVATLSHELRSPLTAIRAYTDTLRSADAESLAPGKLEELLHVVDEEAQRLTRLTESVLDLERFDSVEHRARREPTDLGDLVEEVAGILRQAAEPRNVELKVVRGLADTVLEADQDQLRQLVLHLGSNAVKFTPSGGRVTLRTGGRSDMVRLEVEDTGAGIPEEAIGPLFDRFESAGGGHSRRPGRSGLGLATCRSIAEWHGGRISARSTPGEGSCFTVQLPRQRGPRVVLRPDSGLSESARDVLRLGVEMVAEVMDAATVSFMSVEPDQSLVIQAAIGLDVQVVREARVRRGAGVAGWVVEQRRPVCTSGSEDTNVRGSGRSSYQTGTFLSVPIEAGGELLGVLNVTEPDTGNPFQIEDCHLLLELAETIAHAWRKALATDARQAEVATTKQALRTVVDHVRQSRRRAPGRIALARAVALELGLNAAEASAVAFAATLHDLGMTMIDPEILDGHDPLTPAQKHEIERHVELGDRVLEHLATMGAPGVELLETLQDVREVVMSHHEWWDGTGYPRGLRGTAIPVGARVLAAVDAFESLVTGRPHREPEPIDAAIAVLIGLRDRQFDPDVVDALVRAVARGAWTQRGPVSHNAAEAGR